MKLPRHILPLALVFLLPAAAHAQRDTVVGEIATFGFNFVTRGFAMADGRLLSIEQNPTLYTIIGNTYGGNPNGNFALPQLTG